MEDKTSGILKEKIIYVSRKEFKKIEKRLSEKFEIKSQKIRNKFYKDIGEEWHKYLAELERYKVLK